MTGATEAEAAPAAQHGIGTRFAGRVSRHAAAYGAGSFASALAALVSVVVFTRYLDPTEFGKMAVLTVVVTIVTLLASLTILPGTMRRLYGTTGDADVEAVDEDIATVVSSDPALVASTGLALILAFGVVAFAVVWVLRGEIADLFGGSGDASLIVLAAGAGVAGAIMRFGQYMLRMQLRSVAYLMISLVYTFGSIAVAIPLLANGVGIEAVLIGIIVASGLGAALGLLLLRFDLRRAASLSEAKAILKSGGAYLPVVLSFQTFQLADVLFVAGFASFSQTGLYRVAQRIATPVSFGTGVFQSAWGPLRHDMTQVAVDKLDESGEYTARLVTYYAVFVSALIVTVAVLADQLVRLAGESFGNAAALVPITALSVAGHGWFILAYRTVRAKRKMQLLVGLSTVAAILFVIGAVFLIPGLGAAGAPAAAVIAWAAATLTMVAIGQRSDRLPFEYAKLAKLAALTLGAWAIAQALLPDSALGTIGKVLLLLAWAGSLFVAKIVPFEEVRSLVRYARDSAGTDSKRQLRARIAQLDGVDAELVDQMIRQKRPPEAVAKRTGMSADEVMARTVHALRSAAGGGEPTESDAKLGHLILIRRPHAEQHLGLMAMVHEGADPIDADLVVRAAAVVSSRRWRA
jgi:O-antigen/teichoic acid export membrane protein